MPDCFFSILTFRGDSCKGRSFFIVEGCDQMSWKEIEHTADVGFEVKAASLDELFLESALALYALGYGETEELGKNYEKRKEILQIDGIDLEELVVSWLNELIFIVETRHVLFVPTSVHVIAEPLHITVEGVLSERHGVRLPVKSATYGGLVIRRYPDPFLRIFLDV
ncbi:MAG TPA: hypothetical protein DEP01_08100 [Aminobacterium sp.]|nr:hypothetical protein [Aminobacterium sp.]